MIRVKIVLIIALSVLVLSCGCGDSDKIKHNLYIYLENKCQERLPQLKQSYQYCRNEADFEKARQKELKAAEDYCKYALFALATTKDLVVYGLEFGDVYAVVDPQSPDISRAKVACRQRDEALEAYNKSLEARRNLPSIAKQISFRSALAENLKSEYKTWSVRKIHERVYLIVGCGLGSNAGELCSGKWYYYETDNGFSPADRYAQALLEELE